MTSPSHAPQAAEFQAVLAKYEGHPGVQRKLAQEEAGARQRNLELNRPAYFELRSRIPDKASARSGVQREMCNTRAAQHALLYPKSRSRGVASSCLPPYLTF